MSAMKDFSFQGKVFLSDRQSGGKPGVQRWVDDAAELILSFAADTTKRSESYTGNRLTSAVLQKAKSCTFKLSLNAASADNLALALQGTITNHETLAVVNEKMPPIVSNLDIIMLDYPVASGLVIKDSDTPPTTLVLDTNYEIVDLNAGLVKFLYGGLSAMVQPFKASYTAKPTATISMLTSGPIEKYLVFDGINTVDQKRVIVRIPRAQFEPVSDLELITDDFGQMQLGGEVLFDTVNATDAELGGFASIQIPSEA